MQPPCILVVDDEDLVREVTAMMIQEHGWRVVTAASGMEALEVVQREAGGVVAAVVDFSMPQWNGYETVLRLLEVQPKLGVIMISGLGVIPEIEQMRREKSMIFLPKPFGDEQLRDALVGVLRPVP